jgi:competence protein ComEC
VVGVAPLAKRLPFKNDWLAQSIAVAFIAQIVSFPLLLYHFSEFSILSFFANLLLVPLISISIPLAMGGVWIGFIFEQWEWLIGRFVVFLLDFSLQVSKWLFSLSWAHFTWAKPSVWWLLLFAVSLVYVWIAWIGDLFYRSVHRLIASSCLLLCISYAFVAPLFSRGTQITFLDVGQGEAVVIETKSGQVVMIDGGNRALSHEERWRRKRKPIDMGERIVLPFLKSRGIRQIDYWILTHGDRDHIGGVMAVSKRIPVKQVFRSIHPPKEGLEKELVQFLQQSGVKVSTVQYGFTGTIEEGIYWQFLHPDYQRKLGTKEKGNEDSIVFLLSIEGRRVLLTGDIGQVAEEKILADWRLPPVDILKVAHHGSGSATTRKWLEQLRPREAVISVGEENRYGHPHEEVLARLKDARVRVWRTDRHGAITVRFVNGEYEITSMVGS